VAGSKLGRLRVYDPEAGSVLHRLNGHACEIMALACIASSSAAPHHPRLVSASLDGTAKVWDGETGEMLADLEGHMGPVTSLAVWKQYTGRA
jgi:WD40 repeat protein